MSVCDFIIIESYYNTHLCANLAAEKGNRNRLIIDEHLLRRIYSNIDLSFDASITC